MRGVVEERVAEAALVHQHGGEAGALGLDGAGQPGGAGADDQQVRDSEGWEAVLSIMPRFYRSMTGAACKGMRTSCRAVTSLWAMAKSASSRRVETPVLSKTFDRWRFTVSSLMVNCLAMSLVAAAFDDAGDDFELARGQAVGLALGHGRGLLHQLAQGAQQVDDALAADPVVAGEDGAQGVGEIAGDRILQDDAAGADLQRFDDLLGGDSGGQQHDLDARRSAHDGAHRLQAGQARHLQIEQQDVRLQFERLGDGDVAVFGLADDLEAGLVQQHVLDAEADYRVIVGDDDANG